MKIAKIAKVVKLLSCELAILEQSPFVLVFLSINRTWNNRALPTIHLHLIFEISSLKNQVGEPGFFVYFELDFYCLCSLQKSSSK